MIWILLQYIIVTSMLSVSVFCLCRVFAKHAAICHALWLVVLCRFLLPPLFSPWSISLFAERPNANELAVTATVDSIVVPHASLAFIELHSKRGVPLAPSSATHHPLRVFLSQLRWKQLALAVWLSGSFVFALRYVRSTWRIQKLLAQHRRPTKSVESALERVCDKLGVTAPSIVSTDAFSSPFVWSLSGQIVWPVQFAHLADEQIELMLAHEMAHIRRRDRWIALLETIGRIVWWWNPVYWWSITNLRYWAECSCDVRVIKQQPSLRGVYSRLLIQLAALHSQSSRTGLHTGYSPGILGISFSRRRFERRLKMAMTGEAKNLSLLLTLPSISFVALAALLAIPNMHFVDSPITVGKQNVIGTTSEALDVPDEHVVGDGILAGQQGHRCPVPTAILNSPSWAQRRGEFRLEVYFELVDHRHHEEMASIVSPSMSQARC